MDNDLFDGFTIEQVVTDEVRMAVDAAGSAAVAIVPGSIRALTRVLKAAQDPTDDSVVVDDKNLAILAALGIGLLKAQAAISKADKVVEDRLDQLKAGDAPANPTDEPGGLYL